MTFLFRGKVSLFFISFYLSSYIHVPLNHLNLPLYRSTYIYVPLNHLYLPLYPSLYINVPLNHLYLPLYICLYIYPCTFKPFVPTSLSLCIYIHVPLDYLYLPIVNLPISMYLLIKCNTHYLFQYLIKNFQNNQLLLGL